MSKERVDEKIAKITKEAEILVKRVFKDVPEKYRPFIDLLDQSKRIKIGNFEGRAYFEVPYMGVDGRVQMCEDEHRKAEKTYDMSTDFVAVTDKHVLCKCAVTSPIFGLRTGHAITPLEAKSGAEGSNPFEVAETSAIGRALGFAGYGLIGSGVASLEEVRNAKAAQERADKEDTATPDNDGQAQPFPEEGSPGSGEKSAAEMAAEDPLMQAVKDQFPDAQHVGTFDPSKGEKFEPPKDAGKKGPSGFITKRQQGLAKRRLKEKKIEGDEAVGKFLEKVFGVVTKIEDVPKDKFDGLLVKISEVK